MTKELEKMKGYQKSSPEMLKKVLARKEEVFADVKDVKLKSDSRIFMVANGSSAEGVRVAAFIWERILGIKPYYVNPYLFAHYPNGVKKDDIVLVLSQTGTSHEVLQSARVAKAAGAVTIGITTVPETPITKIVDHLVFIPEGYENVDYKIVGMIVNMLATILVGYGVALANDIETDLETAVAELAACFDRYEDIASEVENWVTANYQWINEASCYSFIGSGSLVEAATELSVKMSEVTNRQTNFYDIEEYMHGACAVTDPHHTLVIFAGNENVPFALKSFNASVKIGKPTVWLGPKGPEGQPAYTMSDDWVIACFDAIAAAHAFVITLGILGNHGTEGAKLFAYYQEELKVREE